MFNLELKIHIYYSIKKPLNKALLYELFHKKIKSINNIQANIKTSELPIFGFQLVLQHLDFVLEFCQLVPGGLRRIASLQLLFELQPQQVVRFDRLLQALPQPPNLLQVVQQQICGEKYTVCIISNL